MSETRLWKHDGEHCWWPAAGVDVPCDEVAVTLRALPPPCARLPPTGQCRL